MERDRSNSIQVMPRSNIDHLESALKLFAGIAASPTTSTSATSTASPPPKPKLDTLTKAEVYGPTNPPYGQRGLLVLGANRRRIAFGQSLDVRLSPPAPHFEITNAPCVLHRTVVSHAKALALIIPGINIRV